MQPNHASNAESAAPQRIVDSGMVLFDEPSEHTLGGWAAVAGEEPKRIENASSLRNDIVWVSNIDFKNYLKGGHGAQHNLRRAEYYRAGIKQLASDIGIGATGGGTYEAVQKLSLVASRVFRMAAEYYNLADGDIANAYLAEDLREKMGIPVKTENPNAQADFLGAYQTDSSVTGAGRSFGENTAMLSLRKNRFKHFAGLLSLPVPDDLWEHLPERVFPPDTAKRLDWVMEKGPDRPILAECVIEPDCDSDVAALTAFGASPGRKTLLRRWVSTAELTWLVRYYKVTVRSAWMSYGYKELPERHKLPRGLVSDDILALSFSAGLLVENHFQALGMSGWNQITSSKTVSPAAVWMKAYDRAIMFAHAMDMHRNGFLVTGYGMGGVRVSVSRAGGELQRLAEYAGENGFVYPPLEAILNV